MSIKKSIKPRNSIGQFHGYQELYNTYGNIIARGDMKKNLYMGYFEWHWGDSPWTHFYIR